MTPDRTEHDRQWHAAWNTGSAVVILSVPTLVALTTGELLLFASLGPTALMQAHAPHAQSVRVYNVVVGHLTGMAAAFGAVALFGLAATPSVFETGTVTPARAAAAIVAIAIATAIEIAVGAVHPPSASTTLLVALGSFHPTWHAAGMIAGGVVLVAITGEIVRHVRPESER